ARSRAWRRRPFLRHSGGEARRIAAERDRTRQARARATRGRGPHLTGAPADRRPAAVRRGAAGGGAATRHGTHRASRGARGTASRRNVAAGGDRSALCAQGATGNVEVTGSRPSWATAIAAGA